MSDKLDTDMKEIPRNVGKDAFKNWHRISRSLEKTKAKRRAMMKEDAPANCAGAGAIAGIGVGLKGEPGVKKRSKKDIVLDTLRRR